LAATTELAAVNLKVFNQHIQERFAQGRLGLNCLSIEFKRQQLNAPAILIGWIGNWHSKHSGKNADSILDKPLEP
jgi:hypothetical protein